MKLQLVEGMWIGFESNFLDRINRITGIFSPTASGPSAEGRYILTIWLILSKWSFFKIGIHASFSLKIKVSYLIRLASV
jgi:hypothetical protein